MDIFYRNAVLNAMSGTIAGAQDYALPWAIASSLVSSLALSETTADQRVIPGSLAEAKQRGIFPMFVLGMVGWYVGRQLFPPPPAALPTVTA